MELGVGLVGVLKVKGGVGCLWVIKNVKVSKVRLFICLSRDSCEENDIWAPYVDEIREWGSLLDFVKGPIFISPQSYRTSRILFSDD